MANSDSAPFGTRHNFAIGRRILMDCPVIVDVKRIEKIKNGNRDGIRDFIQISIPLRTPLIAVCVSNIRTIMQAEYRNAFDFRMFNSITSIESMRQMQIGIPTAIYFLQRRCTNGIHISLDTASGRSCRVDG